KGSRAGVIQLVWLADVVDAHIEATLAAPLHNAAPRGESQVLQIIVRVAAIVVAIRSGPSDFRIRSVMIDTGIAAIGRIRAAGAEHSDLHFGRVALQKGTLRAFPIAGVRGRRISPRSGKSECGENARNHPIRIGTKTSAHVSSSA